MIVELSVEGGALKEVGLCDVVLLLVFREGRFGVVGIFDVVLALADVKGTFKVLSFSRTVLVFDKGKLEEVCATKLIVELSVEGGALKVVSPSDVVFILAIGE